MPTLNVRLFLVLTRLDVIVLDILPLLALVDVVEIFIYRRIESNIYEKSGAKDSADEHRVPSEQDVIDFGHG